MFSLDHFSQWVPSTDASRFLDKIWSKLASDFNLQAIFVILFEPSKSDFKVIISVEVPVEPFNGAEKKWISDVLKDCFEKFPEPHLHNISNFGLPNILKRFSKHINGAHRVWFVPTNAYGFPLIFLGFPRPDCKEKKIPAELLKPLDYAFFAQTKILLAEFATERLKVTEVFVKEMGHDVSSSVQAILAKAQTIADGRVLGEAAKKKAREIEKEIMNTHRVAEFLGTAVEPDYQIGSPDDYELGECINQAIMHYVSEAEERRISLKYVAKSKIPMWGDQGAIEQAIGQLLLNAIKYSYGQTSVEVNVTEDSETATVSVFNKGIDLPSGDDVSKIWDFGFRGKSAMEHHVNGSGIGLYTVRKIASAHLGTVSAGPVGDRTAFRMRLPKRESVRFRLKTLV